MTCEICKKQLDSTEDYYEFSFPVIKMDTCLNLLREEKILIPTISSELKEICSLCIIEFMQMVEELKEKKNDRNN